MSKRVVFLDGDGIGPDVSAAAKRVLLAASEKHALTIEIEHCDFGGIAIDRFGAPFPDETRAACLAADAIFLGAVGGPKWDGGDVRPEAGLLALRKALGAFANLRPVQLFDGLANLSPLNADRVRGVDMLIVRELTGGVYFGKREEGGDLASDLCAYSREEISRIAHVAFKAARSRRGKLASVDKANVLATSRLWRKVVNEIHAADYPDVELEHILVDAMAMKLIQAPVAFDVILTENMFGDILSDEASVIAGSIGLAPSASLGDGLAAGLFEPIHGSAPDIAGTGKANPIGAILSIAMMLRYSLDMANAADDIDRAVAKALANGLRTADLGGSANCEESASAIIAVL